MKKNFRIGVVMCVLLCGGWLAQAHEFWMQPLKFYYAVGEQLVVSFKVGENFIGENWTLKKERLVRIELHQLKGVENITALAVEGEKDQLIIPLKQEGGQVIVMESNTAFAELEAEKFNEYLKEDGLDDAFNARAKNDALDVAGKEFYSRHTKLITQTGKKRDDTWKKSFNLPIEIVPEQNPAELKIGSKVSFKVMYQGKPLFGAKVRVWNRYKNRTTMQPIYSQQDGRIEAHISNPGMWMVSVVQMVPSNDPKADWRSYWGSLVFGVQ
jgi:uncharacterized GH25 family protein